MEARTLLTLSAHILVYIFFWHVICFVGMENDLNLHWFTVISLCAILHSVQCVKQHIRTYRHYMSLWAPIWIDRSVSAVVLKCQRCESSTPLSCRCLRWWGTERLQRILISLCHFSLSFFRCDSDSVEWNRQCCSDYAFSLLVTEVL